MNVYLIGSLRNPRVPEVAAQLREAGHEVFDDWFAAGEHADDAWQAYEQTRGRTYAEALKGFAAEHVHTFDDRHLRVADAVVLLLPAGKSGHLELGMSLGRGQLGYVLLDEPPDRWDVMYRYATAVAETVPELVWTLGADAYLREQPF